MDIASSLLLIMAMLVLCAFFAASETAFVAANRLKAEVDAQRSSNTGNSTRYFLQNMGRMFTTTLVGTNISLLVYSALIAAFLDPFTHQFFRSEVAVSLISALVGSIIVLFVGEIFPKTIAQKRANTLIFALSPPLKLTYWLFYPIITLATWLSQKLAKLFNATDLHGSGFLRQDFENILQDDAPQDVQDENKLDEDERELVSNVLLLRTIRVREAMIPRTQIKAVKDDLPVESLKTMFQATGHSKLPVYHETIDNIIGYVLVHDLFKRPQSLQEMLRPVKYVPESKRSNELLNEFLKTKSSIVIVLDEHGGTAGLVTIEDLIEELIGDIQDEYDHEDKLIRVVNETTLIASGSVELETLADDYQLVLPEGDYETLAGFLMDQFGNIPAINEVFTYEQFKFVILKSTSKRIELVKIIQSTPESN
jgi:CBS domain containing-hemolysin-like protein